MYSSLPSLPPPPPPHTHTHFGPLLFPLACTIDGTGHITSFVQFKAVKKQLCSEKAALKDSCKTANEQVLKLKGKQATIGPYSCRIQSIQDQVSNSNSLLHVSGILTPATSVTSLSPAHEVNNFQTHGNGVLVSCPVKHFQHPTPNVTTPFTTSIVNVSLLFPLKVNVHI